MYIYKIVYVGQLIKVIIKSEEIPLLQHINMQDGMLSHVRSRTIYPSLYYQQIKSRKRA